jgi:glycosyltransferase involved in cell wall biosynthesis
LPVALSKPQRPELGLERCRNLDQLDRSKLEILELPEAHSPARFLKSYRAVRSLLRQKISEADYVIVSPYTLIGDWPTVAAREAARLGKPYVIEADVVYESLAFNGLRGSWWKRLLQRGVLIPQFVRSYRKSLKKSKLALFQGKDVFDAYAAFCSNPHKVEHHIPIYKDDHISSDALNAKLDRIMAGEPLRIVYAGRAVDMKGPLEWLKTVDELLKSGVKLQATWLGDGSLLPLLRTRVEALGIADHVTFPGYVSDRRTILEALQSSDIFLYCHKTKESARVLGEALACGCPIVGYESAYPLDLVSHSGGGLFGWPGDWSELAEHIQHMDSNRDKLSHLVIQAARSGQRFDRTRLLHERMMLVKRWIRPA